MILYSRTRMPSALLKDISSELLDRLLETGVEVSKA